MKSKHITIVILAIILSSCGTNKNLNKNDEKEKETIKETIIDEHSSMNSLDWAGTYYATLPCADCEGVQTTLKLNYDLTFIKNSKHLEKNESIIEDKGSFSWDKTGQIITLKDDKKEQFFIGENRMWKLDLDGNKITGKQAQNYILSKQQTQLTDRHWKLIELNGQKVEYNKKKGNQPYIILRPDEDNKVYGNAGCNQFFGTFKLKENGQISFSQMGATKMYCSNMETEKLFLQTLSKVDNYSLKDDSMTLNKAKMPPLAKFEVAYFE